MLKIIIALGIPVLVTIIQFYLLTDEQKKKSRLILTALSLVGVVVAIWMTAGDATENEAMRKTIKETKETLEQANSKLGDQTKLINDGFTNLNAQLINAGVNNTAILSNVSSLKKEVNQFSDNSQKYFQTSITLAKTTLDQVKEIKGIIINDSHVKIPVTEKNSVIVDAINTFTIVDATTEKEQVVVKVNGYDTRLKPGFQFPLRMADGNARTFVYQGKEDGKLVFYIHD